MILTTKVNLAANATTVIVDPTTPNPPIDPENYEVYPKAVSGLNTVLSATEAIFTVDEFYRSNRRKRIFRGQGKYNYGRWN